jgi:very-short-patch-repair endonuclease
MRLPSVECDLCGKIWREPSQRMREGKTCSKICSSIKGYLNGDRKETGIELKLQELLVSLNIPFITQKPLLGVTVADIFIYPNVAIFADGTYWHRDDLRDQKKTHTLKKHHYVVLRLTEEEINESIDIVRDKLLYAYSSRKIEKKL